MMDRQDALLFIVQCLRSDRAEQYSKYGYDLYVPMVITPYFSAHGRDVQWGSREMLDASPVFLDAAWELARRGILRPGIRRMNTQATEEGSAGFGYSITPFGTQ